MNEQVDPAESWDERYRTSERIWSGRPNAVLVDLASALAPGRALDLGSGEGGDAIWLAEHGWDVTGVDISSVAVRRATDAARARGIPADRIRFTVAELSTFVYDQTFDLITASYLHSGVELARATILRNAADHVAVGGHLLVTSHSVLAWEAHEHGSEHSEEPDAADDVAAFGGNRDEWEILINESRPHESTPGGHVPDSSPHESGTSPHESGSIDDLVLFARRR